MLKHFANCTPALKNKFKPGNKASVHARTTERGSYWNVLVAKCLLCVSFAGTFLGIRSLSFQAALGLPSLPLLRLSLSQHHPVFSSWQTNNSSDPHAELLRPLFLVVSTGHSHWVPSPPWPEQVSVRGTFWPNGNDNGVVQCFRRKWAVRYPHYSPV